MHIMQTQNLTSPYHILSYNILISHEKSIGELNSTLTYVLSSNLLKRIKFLFPFSLSYMKYETKVETQHNHSGTIHNQPDEGCLYTVQNQLQLYGAGGHSSVPSSSYSLRCLWISTLCYSPSVIQIPEFLEIGFKFKPARIPLVC